MPLSFVLTVIRRRDVNGVVRPGGVTRRLTSRSRVAYEICEAMGFMPEIEFLRDGKELASVLLDREAFLACSVTPIRQRINGIEIGKHADYSDEFGALIGTQQDLTVDAHARVFLQLN